MAKLKLVANPTFAAEVGIPVAGADPVPVQFTFKHRTKTALDAWIGARADKNDADSFMEMVEGWDLEDEYNRANVDLLLENYIGVALATYRTYINELVQAKLKN